MLWSLVPRRKKFEPPGTPLNRDTRPLLLAELDDIAASLNEPLPGEVYLIGQVKAFVADRGGILGFGSRRIMAVRPPPPLRRAPVRTPLTTQSRMAASSFKKK